MVVLFKKGFEGELSDLLVNNLHRMKLFTVNAVKVAVFMLLRVKYEYIVGYAKMSRNI